ncbi:MAG: hypothetical protein WBD74_12240 [Candidatus Aquilonibacter sp.]
MLENRYVEIPIETLKARFSNDAEVVSKLSDRDPKNLEFIEIDLAGVRPGSAALMVDPAKRRLVERPALALSADKLQITGDGNDSADIEISVVDANGKRLNGASGAAKVTTSRGKLSTRGGIVNLVKGHATVTLTSANETVNRVRVWVSSPDHSFSAARLDLEFV